MTDKIDKIISKAKTLHTNDIQSIICSLQIEIDEREKKMTKEEIRNEIRSILKDYHYESDTENMSKDVMVALENLVGALK